MISLILGFLLGVVLGSFVDCIANRSLAKRSFLGRSTCDFCSKTLSSVDLIPIVSYLISKGRCRYCKKAIPKETLLVEVLMGSLVSLLFFLKIPPDFLSLNYPQMAMLVSDLLFGAFIISVLVSVFITDIKESLIPDRITYPAIAISFIYLVINSAAKAVLIYYSLQATPLGKYLLPPHSDFYFRQVFYNISPLYNGLIAALMLGAFFLVLILITKGRGMGGGDLKLGIFLGLVLGIENSLLALMLSFLSGSIISIALIILRVKKLGDTIPFGPFLAAGALISLFWGSQLIKLYTELNFSLKIPY